MSDESLSYEEALTGKATSKGRKTNEFNKIYYRIFVLENERMKLYITSNKDFEMKIEIKIVASIHKTMLAFKRTNLSSSETFRELINIIHI